MLLRPSHLSEFNSMVSAIEGEAYELLRCRSGVSQNVEEIKK